MYHNFETNLRTTNRFSLSEAGNQFQRNPNPDDENEISKNRDKL